MIQEAIYKYAKNNNIEMNDGEKYDEIYKRILKSNPRLHSRRELKELSKSLLILLTNKYGFKATRVFAYYPVISTKNYVGFDEIYLYQNIYDDMTETAQKFIKTNNIIEDLDKELFQYEFKKVYSNEIGYFPLSNNNYTYNLIHFMELIHTHFFDKEYVKFLEGDIKRDLKSMGDKYFINLDLTVDKNIRLLYDVCGISYGFYGFREDVYSYYDGNGNVFAVNGGD